MGNYRETVWKNGVTPLNASNMNNIEIGIQENKGTFDYLNERINTLSNSIPDWVIHNTRPSWATVHGIGADVAIANAINAHNISLSAHDGVLAKKEHTHTLSQITNFPNPSLYPNNATIVTQDGEWVGKTLASVAFSGDYRDLSNVPAVVSAFINDAGYITYHDLRQTANGVWSGGDITLQQSFTCGFAPVQLVITEKDINGVTTGVYNLNTDYVSGDTRILFTQTGFTAVSSANGQFNRDGYTYSWEASAEGFNGLPDVSIADNGKVAIVYNGSWAAGYFPKGTQTQEGVVSIGNGIDVDDGRISLKSEYADYLNRATYSAPSINAFSLYDNDSIISTTIMELGSTLTVTKISHSETNCNNINGTLSLFKGNSSLGDEIVPSGIATFADNFTSSSDTPLSETSLTYKLRGFNTLGDVFQRAITIYFRNRIFWGIGGTTISASDVLNLSSSVLSNDVERTISVTASVDEYIWYVYPKRLGSAIFTVGGFEGGFNNPMELTITNSSGFSEPYYLYRSVNSNLGVTTIVITPAQ